MVKPKNKKEFMTGKEIKKRWPKWAEKHKIRDTDFIYLAGKKIKVLREG